MKHHLIYLCSPKQKEISLNSLVKLGVQKIKDIDDSIECFKLQHESLAGHVLNIHIITDPSFVGACLRRYPIDLFVYDERGFQADDTVDTLKEIQKDIEALGNKWGPDSVFPMSRAAVILKNSKDNPIRTFSLSRLQIRNVIESPLSTLAVIKWIRYILTHSTIMQNPKLGVTLSGGGLEGLLYQLGVIHALECAFQGRNINSAEIFSGMSSGSICAAMLANRTSSYEVIKSVLGYNKPELNLSLAKIYRIAGKELLFETVKKLNLSFTLSPKEIGDRMERLFPSGLFTTEYFKEFIEAMFKEYGGKLTFKELEAKLFIGATDLENYEHVVFGEEPWDNINIADAIIASASLPPFFVPKKINDKYFIDGQITRTANLKKSVDAGCNLMLVIDPMIPAISKFENENQKKGGFFNMIQVIKALVHSRFKITLQHITEQYPDTNFIVFQPNLECAEAMAGSPMKFRIRSQIIRLAFQCTLRQLIERHHIYKEKLENFGITLKSKAELSRLLNLDPTSKEYNH